MKMMPAAYIALSVELTVELSKKFLMTVRGPPGDAKGELTVTGIVDEGFPGVKSVFSSCMLWRVRWRGG